MIYMIKYREYNKKELNKFNGNYNIEESNKFNIKSS